jgi:hypothetical protein
MARWLLLVWAIAIKGSLYHGIGSVSECVVHQEISLVSEQLESTDAHCVLLFISRQFETHFAIALPTVM